VHLKKKYALKPVEKHLWKFLRLRPVNFPTIRLAQFAALLSKSEFLFSKVMACSDIEALYHIFQVSASAFWDTHYSFETSGPLKRKLLGNEAISILVINAVIPFLFIYGKMTANENLKDRSLNWLNQIPPERNRLIRRWEQWGFKPTSAYYTQGIIQMMNTCCNQKKCINCSIGAQIITAVE
jgi:hypothetical protein